MTTQNKLPYVWADGGGQTPVDTVKYSTGWIAEIPSYQNFNYVLSNNTKNILVHAEQHFYEWEAAINYKIGARVREAGVTYTCRVAHTNQQPSLDATHSYWVTGIVISGTSDPALAAQEGLKVDAVNSRLSVNTWDGNDITIQNESSVVALNTAGATDNMLLANVSGNAVIVNVGTSVSPDGRSIAVGQSGVGRIYSELYKPTQTDVSGTIPDSTSDGQIYGRQDGSWVKVTGTTVQDTPPPPVQGNGQGWYNLDDGKHYIDIDDGDTSQWVPASPPTLPVSKAIDVTYDDTDTGLGDNVHTALDQVNSRNWFENPNFLVWQRGTSPTVPTTTGPLCDRWEIRGTSGTGGSSTLTMQPNNVGSTMRLETSGHTDYSTVSQKVSLHRLGISEVSGKTFTMTLQTDHDFATDWQCRVQVVDHAGGTTPSGYVDFPFSVSAGPANTSVEITFPALGAVTFNEDTYLEIRMDSDSALPDGFYRWIKSALRMGTSKQLDESDYAGDIPKCERWYYTGSMFQGGAQYDVGGNQYQFGVNITSGARPWFTRTISSGGIVPQVSANRLYIGAGSHPSGSSGNYTFTASCEL